MHLLAYLLANVEMIPDLPQLSGAAGRGLDHATVELERSCFGRVLTHR